MSKTIIEVKNLCKSYGGVKAISDLSFSIKEEEIVGVLGPNGAGKTTTISIILGVLKPTAGSVFIYGEDMDLCRQEALEKLNFTAVYAQLPGNLTVWENLYFFGLLYAVKNLKSKINFLLKEFSLEKFAGQKTGNLSSGEQSRVNIAKSLINSPRLILFDEPTASLDPVTSRELREKIKSYIKKENASVLWTSHNMYEIENVCDRIIFLSRGKIILEGRPAELLLEYGKKNLEELFIAAAKEPI